MADMNKLSQDKNYIRIVSQMFSYFHAIGYSGH